jgi:release factor glutamine methyltransferase
VFYSYQDCWNYVFSGRKFEPKTDLQRDLISICQTNVADFWFNFSRQLLTKSRYLNICHKIDEYSLARYPAPYLSNEVGFYQLVFRTEKGVFIPQRDTEVLVEKLLELVNKKWKKRKLWVLDIGTGCGNIAISLAKINPNWQIVALDKSRKALKLAKSNSLTHRTSNVEFYQSDLFDELDSCQKFDVIVSNPPYISSTEYQQLSSLVKRQPKSALVARKNGYFFYQEIFRKVPVFFLQKFLLILEIGSQQEERLLGLARKHFSSAHVEIFPDLSGNSRVLAVYK